MAVEEDAPSVGAVARALGMSPFQLIRGFKGVFGATPHQLRTEVRLERAKWLLACESMPVTEVCLAVGFQGLGSFSALFSRRVGSSPSAYRRRVRRAYPVPEALARAIEPGCFALMAHLPAGALRNFREAPGRPAVVAEGERSGGSE